MRSVLGANVKYLEKNKEVVQLPLLRSTIETHPTGVQ